MNGWVREVTAGASARSIGKTVNRSHTAISRWLKAEEMPCEVVLEIARVYQADPIRGLIAAGYVTTDDLLAGGSRNLLSYVPSSMLIQELAHRSKSYEKAVRGGSRWNPPHRVSPLGEDWLV